MSLGLLLNISQSSSIITCCLMSLPNVGNTSEFLGSAKRSLDELYKTYQVHVYWKSANLL
jgi:hypothetical protein